MSTTRRTTTRAGRPGRRGFTLIELMVALTVGGVAISTFYTLSRSTSTFFQEQSRIANLQHRLHHGMAQVKRDFRLAGYMAASNLATRASARRCGLPVAPFAAGLVKASGVMRFDADFPGQVASGVDPGNLYTGNPAVGADRVWLLANFETEASYQGIEFNPNQDTMVTLKPASSYSAQSAFGDWQNGAPNNLDTASFNSAFRVGRPIALSGPTGVTHLAIPTAINSGGFSTGAGVIFNFAPGARGPDGACELDKGWIAPLETVEYQVLPAAAGGEDDTLKLDTAAEPLPQLHRREISLATGGPMAGGEDRVVMDYVVGFRVGFITDGGTITPNDRDNINWVANNPLAIASPETIRGVRITLSARSPGHDNNLPATLGPLQAFRMDPNRPGAAHVRTLRADIFMPNMATR